MTESEISLRLGQIEFSGKGDAKWLSEEIAKLVALAKELGAIDEAKERVKVGSNGDSPGVVDAATARGRWMRTNGLTEEHLASVFHNDNGTYTIIAGTIPGSTNKEKTINCYLLEGARRLLADDKPTFDDAAARELCKTMGCYDGPNHAGTIKASGNKLSGSKGSGWTLPAPGLKEAANVIKQIT